MRTKIIVILCVVSVIFSQYPSWIFQIITYVSAVVALVLVLSYLDNLIKHFKNDFKKHGSP